MANPAYPFVFGTGCAFWKRWLLGIGSAMVFGFLVLGIGIFLVLPPWDNYAAARIQGWLLRFTGVSLHTLTDYTGRVCCWDEHGVLRRELYLVHGERHGEWIDYDATGQVVSRSEYRSGQPWNGVCYISDGKAFQGEYKEGKEWNGYLPVTNPQTGKTEWICFLDGQRLSPAEYRRRQSFPPDVDLVGLGYWEPD